MCRNWTLRRAKGQFCGRLAYKLTGGATGGKVSSFSAVSALARAVISTESVGNDVPRASLSALQVE